jgi:hypothetical protein
LFERKTGSGGRGLLREEIDAGSAAPADPTPFAHEADVTE